MTSTIVKYHDKTTDLAVFIANEDGMYWIGEYDPFCTHQNSEPPYVMIEGYWDCEHDALSRLSQLIVN
jgi:hypothetical protein